MKPFPPSPPLTPPSPPFPPPSPPSPTSLLLSTAFVLAALTAWPAAADPWPAWRGPSGNGISAETNLPLTWSRTENIAWRLPLTDWSGSTPIVSGDTVFVNVADGRRLFLWAVDRDTGGVRWTRHLADNNRHEGKQNMSTPSPVTDGEHVWVLTGTGLLKAFETGGRQIWTRDLQADYGRFGLNWGYASSPLLHDDSLYVQVVHGMKTSGASYLLRIDKQSGRTRWRVERPTSAAREAKDAYTTPALLQYEGSIELVVSGADAITGHDLATGRELWRAEALNPRRDPVHRIVASPVVMGGFIYVPTRERPLLAIRAGGRGDVTASHVAWTFDTSPDVPTPVSDGRHLFVVRDNGVMFCLDGKTGAVIYGPERLPPATYSGSPVLADGRIYVTNEDGVTVVVRAGPSFEVLSANDLGEYTLSSPAVSDGQIFIRTDAALYAIGRRRTAD